MSVDPRSWSISNTSSCNFLLALATLFVTSLWSRSRIVGPKELKAQLGELDICYNLSSFLKDIMKMADIDIDPFGNHKMDTQSNELTDKNIPLTPGGVIGLGAIWEPEQETSFGGTSIREKVLRENTEGLYQKLSEITHQTPEAFRFD